MSLEQHFDATFTARLAVREKQIQQNYRPIIGIHKWFARRPGTVFRNLLLAEFNGRESLDTSYWRAHAMRGVIADPFMGGGTPIYEANRLGFSVVGTDVNPMAYWVVRQSLAPLDLVAFTREAERVIAETDWRIADFYRTICRHCGDTVPVKYFLWVKVQQCPGCGTSNDLFPGYLLAEAGRHPRHVVACPCCGALNEYAALPSAQSPAACLECGGAVTLEGRARRGKAACPQCQTVYAYPEPHGDRPPRHRLWAMEYHCASCKEAHTGRFFKRPDADDLARYTEAAALYRRSREDLPVPSDAIPAGDETDRLHRWGYRRYADMFGERQLLGLGLLLREVLRVEAAPVRHALLTVFSDFLRYQNMLCRYDTKALKCQDIFSVHGFPVGLVQCENNLLGIPRVGSGAFRHFVEKYTRAKVYCLEPFETRQDAGRKQTVPVVGERISAELVSAFPAADRQAWLLAAPATALDLAPATLDGVFTDPPYYDNVQYAELMDFCYAWLRLGLHGEVPAFEGGSTRNDQELTANATLGRGLEQFTAGLSAVFRHYAAALKPAAPFVFTYHHNDALAYVPLVVAILDAGLDCTAALAAPAEMSASLHIAGTGSSIIDSVFVCRAVTVGEAAVGVGDALANDVAALAQAGLRVTDGDRKCLRAGHLARSAVNQLRHRWSAKEPLAVRMQTAQERLLAADTDTDTHSTHQRGAAAD